MEANQIKKDLGFQLKPIINEGKEFDNSFKESKWYFSNNIYEGFDDSDAVVVLTEWEEYSKINWEKVSKVMRKPAWVFDARSIVKVQEVKKANLNFWRIGDGS